MTGVSVFPAPYVKLSVSVREFEGGGGEPCPSFGLSVDAFCVDNAQVVYTAPVTGRKAKLPPASKRTAYLPATAAPNRSHQRGDSPFRYSFSMTGHSRDRTNAGDRVRGSTVAGAAFLGQGQAIMDRVVYRLQTLVVRVISKPAILEFSKRRPDALVPFMNWRRITRRADWGSLAEVRSDFAHADIVGRRTVFNIHGNDYRLIARVNYRPNACC